jgi:very-short-patch-repair endonuclease
MERKPIPSKHAQLLYDALQKRRIKCELEVLDGNKHIDLSIEWAELDIEIDGIQHFTNPKQIHSDLERAYWSGRDGYDTIHIPNILIEKHLEEIADAIAKVARERYQWEKEDEENDDEF